MSYLPTPEKCIKILKQNGCSEKVINHCIAVRDVAVKIAKKAKADINLVEVGALLHDIGRARTHGIRHGVEGVKIAEKLDLPVSIIHIIERHLGAGIPKLEAEKLGLPSKDYIPITLEEKIVCHADNMIENCKRQKIEREIKKALIHSQTEYANRLIALHKEISDICGMDIDKI